MKNITFLLTATLFVFSNLAFAQDRTLVTYSKLSAPNYLDIAPMGVSLGDQYLRHGNVHLTPGGPEVGEYYTTATIIFLDQTIEKSARLFFGETIFPEGSLYKKDIVRMEHGRPIEEGHIHEGAIVGGTGEYAGIRGTYTIEILPSGIEAKTTYRFWVGK